MDRLPIADECGEMPESAPSVNSGAMPLVGTYQSKTGDTIEVRQRGRVTCLSSERGKGDWFRVLSVMAVHTEAEKMTDRILSRSSE